MTQYYPILAFVIKFILIIIVYFFIYHIARLIQMDILTITAGEDAKRLVPHVKLLFGSKEVFPLTKAQTVIGRGSFCDVVVPDHHVSSKHAEIKSAIEPGGAIKFYITDLKSANGTFVNGTRIDQKVWLKDGDLIALGPAKLVFQEGGQAYV